MNAPLGVSGVSKNQIFLKKIELLFYCAKIAPKRHKLQKIVKTKIINVWGQSYRTKHQMACLVDSGASFNTPEEDIKVLVFLFNFF